MLLVALTLNVAGIACLYDSWRTIHTHRPWQVLAGWVLLVLAAWAWIAAIGAEFGICLVVLVSGVVAWAMVMIDYVQRGRRQRRSNAPRMQAGGATVLPVPAASAFARQLWLFVVAVPLAGAAAAFATTAITRMLPWQQGNELVLALYLVPVVWGLAAWWASAAPRSAAPALVFTLTLSISLWALYGARSLVL